jgi:hypothetical protein
MPYAGFLFRCSPLPEYTSRHSTSPRLRPRHDTHTLLTKCHRAPHSSSGWAQARSSPVTPWCCYASTLSL